MPIDGSITPHLIPDTTAHALLFNFFSDRADSERDDLQSYCDQTPLAGVDLDSLLATAAYYQQQVALIDAEAQTIRDRSSIPSNAQVAVGLSSLRAKREAVTMEVIASLPSRLGSEGALAVRKHVDERVKPRTKITPGPMMPHGEISMRHH